MKRETRFTRRLSINASSTGLIATGLFLLGLTAVLATAADDARAGTAGQSSSAPVVYPAKGQSAAMMERDKTECHGWGKSQSGHDPSQTSASSTPSAQRGRSAGGIARGALGGAAVGELARNDPGRGAAVGILAAGVRERVKLQRVARQQQAARDQQRGIYDRAFSACMQGRGYVVT